MSSSTDQFREALKEIVNAEPTHTSMGTPWASFAGKLQSIAGEALRREVPDLSAALPEAVYAAARHAHAGDRDTWGYDAEGVHQYSPDHSDSCKLCRALAELGLPEEV